jgi:hypothetical protein
MRFHRQLDSVRKISIGCAERISYNKRNNEKEHSMNSNCKIIHRHWDCDSRDHVPSRIVSDWEGRLFHVDGIEGLLDGLYRLTKVQRWCEAEACDWIEATFEEATWNRKEAVHDLARFEEVVFGRKQKPYEGLKEALGPSPFDDFSE